MSSEKQFEFTKENIDLYLKEVAKEYRKKVGKSVPAELILIGGASVLINYGFRNMTTDIDALIQAASAMKDAINNVRDRYELPNGWLNTDFHEYGFVFCKAVPVFRVLQNLFQRDDDPDGCSGISDCYETPFRQAVQK